MDITGKVKRKALVAEIDLLRAELRDEMLEHSQVVKRYQERERELEVLLEDAERRAGAAQREAATQKAIVAELKDMKVDRSGQERQLSNLRAEMDRKEAGWQKERARIQAEADRLIGEAHRHRDLVVKLWGGRKERARPYLEEYGAGTMSVVETLEGLLAAFELVEPDGA